jgi:hypothetical protein
MGLGIILSSRLPAWVSTALLDLPASVRDRTVAAACIERLEEIVRGLSIRPDASPSSRTQPRCARARAGDPGSERLPLVSTADRPTAALMTTHAGLATRCAAVRSP